MTNATDHDDDVAEAEIVDDSTTADVTGGQLVRQESALLTTAAPLDQIAGAFTQHVSLVDRIVTRDDWQVIQGKQFLKKGGLRKLATAYGVSAEIIERDLTVDPATGRVTRAEFVVRATAPNGRTMDGYGSCDLTDKCKGGNCKKPDHDPSEHFSHPNHDIPATAETRAKNRAFSDLFAMGQVTAEEVGDPERWELLGYPSGAAMQNLMDPLVAALRADAALAEKWKAWRTEHNVEWPVPYAAARDVRVWMAEHINGEADEYEIPEPAREDGARRPEHVEVEREVAAPAPSQPPAPSAPEKPKAPKPKLAPTPAQLQKLAITCGEIAESYGLTDRAQKDEVRHAFVRFVTESRVESGTKMSREEASRAIDLLSREPHPFVLVVTGEVNRPLYFESREAS